MTDAFEGRLRADTCVASYPATYPTSHGRGGSVEVTYEPVEHPPYPYRIRCSGCGWVDSFREEDIALSWAADHAVRNFDA